MIAARLIRKKAAAVPEVRWSKQFLDECGKVVEGSTLDMIKKQQTADGGRLKMNAPSTRARKRRLGRPRLSLVDEKHRFVKGARQSWKIVRYLPRNTGIVVAAANAELAKLVKYVVGMGYTGWLGLSKNAGGAIKAAMRKDVKRMFREARSRGGK